ncbi:MAG TPA: transcription termination/antitermination NusG family protein [Thermoanaerobaculia bacterium]|nr:transcription termination/antitermination NusG family protein [Thermoanaerobaculia bacterium]
MPILKSEVALFPPDLFALPARMTPWRVAYVRSRQEKALARHLLRHAVAFYLPLEEKLVQRAGRRFVSQLPLFPGYVFFRGAVAERLTALASDRVASVLDVLDQTQLDAELRALWRLQESGAALVSHPYLGPGDLVRVVEGPFQGLSGTVLREKGRTRLVVSVTFLRRSVAGEFERQALAPARPGRDPAREIEGSASWRHRAG